MSVKAMGLVWDMECPAVINGLDFKPGHKYTLLAYADHADHHGKNIYPSVRTIARKTGYKTRNIQYLTRELQAMGILIPDGKGPHGVNRWRLAYDEKGTRIAPMQSLQGAKYDKSLGAKNDDSLDANFAPELKEPEPIALTILENKLGAYEWWPGLKTQIGRAVLKVENRTVIVSGLGDSAAILADRYAGAIRRALQISTDITRVEFAE